MRLVITGALGHIGSRLIRSLPRSLRGAEVLMIDNLSTQRYASLFDLPAGARLRFEEADILTADLEALFANADVVIHLAAITDAVASVARREEVEEVNFAGTQRVALACARAGAALLFASTTSVYGTSRTTVDETCPEEELRPQSPYAEAKLKAERLLEQLGHSTRLRHATCRLGTIFGPSPGMRFHTAINKFCWQTVLGQPLTVWRTALGQRRPYLELGDAVRAMEFIVRERMFDGGLFNVVTLNATVQQVLDAIAIHARLPGVQLVDSPIMNQLSYDVATERFRAAGFRFTGSLAAGVGETIALLRALHPHAVTAE